MIRIAGPRVLCLFSLGREGGGLKGVVGVLICWMIRGKKRKHFTRCGNLRRARDNDALGYSGDWSCKISTYNFRTGNSLSLFTLSTTTGGRC